MPTNLPHGWDFEKVFGEDPENPRIKAELDGELLTKLAMLDGPATSDKDAQTQGIDLPQGAAGTELQILLGLFFLLSGTTVLLLLRTRMVPTNK
jgi:Ca-activated chloride channel family protein